MKQATFRALETVFPGLSIEQTLEFLLLVYEQNLRETLFPGEGVAVISLVAAELACHEVVSRFLLERVRESPTATVQDLVRQASTAFNIFADDGNPPQELVDAAYKALDSSPVVVEVQRFTWEHEMRLGSAKIAAGPAYIKAHVDGTTLETVTSQLAATGHPFSVRYIDEHVSLLDLVGEPQ